MKRAVLFFCLIVVPAALFGQWHGPDAPDSLSFQGLLTEPDGTPIDTSVAMTFAFYKGSNKVWEQTHGSVIVTDGVFNVILGGSGAASLDTVAFNEPIDVGVKVGNNSEMTPRTPLTAAAYALGMRGMYAVTVEEGALDGVNVIGGASNNFVEAGIVGATVGGGGGTNSSVGYPDSVMGHWGTVAGGYWNTADGFATSVGGGGNNKARGFVASIAGGIDNVAMYQGAVAGGSGNKATGNTSFVGAGTGNTASGELSTITGGYANKSLGVGSTVGGGEYHIAAGEYSVVSGGQQDTASGNWSVVGGGYRNLAGHSFATIGGGNANRATQNSSTVGGGSDNKATNQNATVGGGSLSTASGPGATVGGGSSNTASGNLSTISGGWLNEATIDGATIGGGWGNTASGQLATVPGGSDNQATKGWSLAAGQSARALHSGTFVWADSAANSYLGVPFESTDENQFLIRASGGVGIGTNAPDRLLHIRGSEGVVRVDRPTSGGGASILLHQYQAGSPDTPWNSFVLVSSASSSGVGAFEIRDLGTAVSGSGALRMRIDDDGFFGLNTGSSSHPLQVGTGGNTSTGNGAHVTTGGVWTDASSRTFKTNFEDVDSRAILDRLAVLPIATWEYKESNEGRHMGPVAEDFHEAFGLGDNERYISGTDARGVSMAAIQGLYELVQEQQALIVNLTARLEELENR